ncbi:MAG: hypothetical protein AB7T31_04150 [Gemmatimonadales bacterium]
MRPTPPAALSLVVTDPPHGRVDHQAVADALGLELPNASLKIGFSAPEVLRCADPSRAVPFAHVLGEAGLRVGVIDGAELARVPWPAPVTTVSFGPNGLVGLHGARAVGIRYSEPVLAVLCKPPLNYTRPSSIPPLTPTSKGIAVAEALDGMAILDLYTRTGGQLDRITIAHDVADFAGIEELEGVSPTDRLKVLLAECGRRFERLTIDARLENVRPRRRFVAGEAGFDMDLRKHYSFGTLLLRHALEEISPDLKDLPHYEYGSRLACVLGKGAFD